MLEFYICSLADKAFLPGLTVIVLWFAAGNMVQMLYKTNLTNNI